VAHHLHTSKLGPFLTFSGYELNYFLTITCVLSTEMGGVNPFSTSTFQKFSNGTRNFNLMNFDHYNRSLKVQESIRTPTSKLLEVGAHSGVWVHSFTPSYTHGSMKFDFQTSLLCCTFASPCLGPEPKARVAKPNLGGG
jgi:hypothetical protein